MNKYKLNSIALLLLALLSITVTSCDQDAEGTIYNPDKEACYSFASEFMTFEVTTDDNGAVKVPVYRGEASTDAVVNITVDEASELFEVSPSVSFASGENTGYVTLTYGNLDNLGTDSHTLKLSIDEALLSPSGVGQIEVTVKRQLTYEYIGDGIYYSQFFGESWLQPVYRAQEAPVFRLIDCYYTGYPIQFTMTADYTDLVDYPIQPMGYNNSNYGMVYFTPSGFALEGNVLQFPMQGVVEYNGGWGLLYNGFVEAIQMPDGWNQ